MNILIIGSGGREHCLAWKLAQDPAVRVHATPGNPGMRRLGHIHAAPDPVRVAQAEAIDLTVVGPEAPLVEGIVDRFRQAGLRIVGPTAAAAQLEGSKIFAKELMDDVEVPTARFQAFDALAPARRALSRFEYPLVIKADGLAAGKGVFIVRSRAEADTILERMFSGELAGEAGKRVILEDFCPGEEVSLIALSDGEAYVTLPPAQDHKPVFDGDRGPNTGGMGAYSDDRLLSRDQLRFIQSSVLQPVIRAMAQRGTPFQGFLYAGLMITPTGPRVLEFNVRLGDPEAQAILYRLDTNLAELLDAAAAGRLADVPLRWRPEPAVCVVLAAQNYPAAPRRGDPIEGIEAAESMGVTVFHAGTAEENGSLVTHSGRVLGVTASGESLPAAIRRAYDAVSRIHFPGMHYRRDIGAKGLKRW